MPGPALPCDVLVVGGGPAGATAARLLASWGRDVVLVARPEPPGPDLPEALTPSCQKFFDLLGISPAVDAAGFIRSTGHTVWWGGAERVEPFDGGRTGWQVTTGRLAAVMLDAAARAGVRVVSGALTHEEVLAWPARYRVDATGRGGVLARPLGRRRYEPGHRTVALIGRWHRRAGAWPVPHPTHTLLESYGDGWAWSVPIDGVTRALAVMVDPATTALARGDGATTIYRAEIAKTSHLARIFADAELPERPTGWDASMYLADHLVGPDWLLAGDAASAVDPLSSAGARKAMASGWQVAAALNTALGTPALADTALRCHAARERDTYRRFLTLTRRFHAQGAPAAHPFWLERAGDGDAAEVAGDEADVRRAFETLKAAPTIALRLAPDVRIEPRPAWRERDIALEPRLVTPLVPDGVRHVGGIDLVPLVELAPAFRDVADLFDAYVSRCGPTDLGEFLRALSTAVARRWLLGG
jgi:flavin-dependent dehydrogenase